MTKPPPPLVGAFDPLAYHPHTISRTCEFQRRHTNRIILLATLTAFPSPPKMRLARLSAFLGFLATAALAADVTLYLTAPPNPYSLPPTTHATLTSLRRRIAAPLSASNAFVFRNVQPGSYLLDVHCSTDGFKPLRVDVTAADDVEVWETFRGNDWANRGERLALRDGSAGRGVDAKPLGGKQYFTERQKCKPASISLSLGSAEKAEENAAG